MINLPIKMYDTTRGVIMNDDLTTHHYVEIKDLYTINDRYLTTHSVKDNTPVSLKANNDSEIEGFLLPAWKIALITDKEFFGQQAFDQNIFDGISERKNWWEKMWF